MKEHQLIKIPTKNWRLSAFIGTFVIYRIIVLRINICSKIPNFLQLQTDLPNLKKNFAHNYS